MRPSDTSGTLLLCEATIDVVVDFGNLVGRVDNDGRALAFADLRESCHLADSRMVV